MIAQTSQTGGFFMTKNMNKEIFLPLSESQDQKLDWESRGIFTEDDIRNLLIDAGFQHLVTQALSRTNTEGHKIFGRLLGQEFGFFGLGKFSSENEGLHLSPLSRVRKEVLILKWKQSIIV